MTTSNDWDGTERRADWSLAVNEVRGLKESVLALAEAVGATMSRDELFHLVRRTNRLVLTNVVLNLVALALLVFL